MKRLGFRFDKTNHAMLHLIDNNIIIIIIVIIINFSNNNNFNIIIVNLCSL